VFVWWGFLIRRMVLDPRYRKVLDKRWGKDGVDWYEPRYEPGPESLISGTLNKVNTMRNLLNQVTGGSQLTNSCTSDMSTEPSSMATFDGMAKRH
jgi:hypothetical protein